MRTIHHAPLVVATSGKVGGVRQREVLVVGNEALGLAPAAAAGIACAAHHHVIPVGGVGRQTCEGGTVLGAGVHEGLALLVAGLPVAEGIVLGGADGRMGQGVQRGRGGSDAVGRKHRGHTAGGSSGEFDTLPVAAGLVFHHWTHPEAVVMVCLESVVDDIGCRGGVIIISRGFGQIRVEKVINPFHFGVARHPTHNGAVSGNVADGKVGDGAAGNRYKAKLNIGSIGAYSSIRSCICKIVDVNVAIIAIAANRTINGNICTL